MSYPTQEVLNKQLEIIQERDALRQEVESLAAWEAKCASLLWAIIDGIEGPGNMRATATTAMLRGFLADQPQRVKARTKEFTDKVITPFVEPFLKAADEILRKHYGNNKW